MCPWVFIRQPTDTADISDQLKNKCHGEIVQLQTEYVSDVLLDLCEMVSYVENDDDIFVIFR